LLDIELFRKNLAIIIDSEEKRFKDPKNAEKTLELDQNWRSVLTQLQNLRKERNEISIQIGKFRKAGNK